MFRTALWTALKRIVGWTATPPPAVTPPVATTSREESLLANHNAARAGVHAGPLQLDAVLTACASVYAVAMANADQLSHNLAGGLSARLARAGYGSYVAAGENIAEGYPDAVAVMQGWFNSPPHYANIVNPVFTAVGFGSALDRSGVRFWCAVFACPHKARRFDPATVHAPSPLVAYALRESSRLTPDALPTENV